MTIEEAIKHCMDIAETQEMCSNGKKCAKEHRQLAEWLKELKQLREQTGWVSVSERLPEDDEDVLVQMTDYSMMVDFRTASSSGWFWAEKDDLPIAWMPLPEPYKEAVENDLR